MKQQILQNLRWIIPGTILLLLTNYLSCTQYKSLSRKETRELQFKIDSLKSIYNKAELEHLANQAKLQEVHKADVKLLEEITAVSIKDKKLVRQQQKALDKYKDLTGSELVATLDSIYTAEVPVKASDSSVVVKKDHLAFSLGKISQVEVLLHRIQLKDTVIDLTNQRLKTQTEATELWKKEANLYKDQRDTQSELVEIKDLQLEDTKSKTKSLKKQNIGLKVGILALLVGIIYTAGN